MHIPTPEQALIIEAARTTSDNLIINALAGSAKTTTLEMICHAITGIPILSLAFNKRIAEEMAKRLPSHVEVRTLNALGHRVWAQAINKRLVVNTNKMHALVKGIIDELPRSVREEAYEDIADTLKWLRFAKRDGFIPSKWAGVGHALVWGSEWYCQYDEEPTNLQREIIEQAMVDSIRNAYAGEIDFDDQLYMPVCFGGTWPKFPLVLCDEVQDLSPINHVMLEKLVHQRVIIVGDPYQCHPPGTLITMTGGEQIPIEKVEVGQQVVSYFTRESIFRGMRYQGRKIEAINTEEFSGNLIVIEAGDKKLKVTPNHKCLVRFESQGGYCLYLMRRNHQYRIGMCRLQYKEGAGLPMRARQEKADAAWLLEIYPDEETCRIYENAFSGMFGVPQLLFQYPDDRFPERQKNIDAAWSLIGDNERRAFTALNWFNRDIRFPIWKGDESNQHFGTKSFITEGCNLINGMKMCVLPNFYKSYADKSREWREIAVNREHYHGPVFGITVESTEGGRRLYLANEIVTHNSIYGFRGSVSNGMEALRDKFNMRELTLSTTFRVPKLGVERAWFRVPHMRAPDTQIDGHIEVLQAWEPEDISDYSAIICRNNAPLFSCALRLIKSGRAIKLVGMDIGPGLVRVMKKLGPPTLNRVGIGMALESWLNQELARAKRVETVYERYECLRVLACREDCLYLGQAIAFAEALFKQDGPIQLLSGHKAKGLEWKTVYHLDPWRIPSKFVKEGTEEYEQELNVRYVIETRFKENLYLINLEDMR